MKNARVENSSMLDRLPRDGFSEIPGRNVSEFRRFQCFKVVETLKHCHLETLPSIYLRMPSFVMTVL